MPHDSFLGSALGRQYVDGRIRDALLASFAARSRAEGQRRFVMGETGWPRGGRFRPHRSHQNGMAVDVFMPVRTRNGDPATLGTWPWNKFGYGLEFNERGEMGNLRIDFESVAAFLLTLEHEARQRGLRVGRIIITPEFVPLLLDAPSGHRLGRLADLVTRKPVWVRHDEHFHIEFDEVAASETQVPTRSARVPSPSGWCEAYVFAYEREYSQVILEFDGGRCASGAVTAWASHPELRLRWLDATTLEVQHPSGVRMERNASGEVIRAWARDGRIPKRLKNRSADPKQQKYLVNVDDVVAVAEQVASAPAEASDKLELQQRAQERAAQVLAARAAKGR